MGNLPKGYKDPIKYAAYLERQKDYKKKKRAIKNQDYYNNQQSYRGRNLQRNYGISLVEYEDLWKSQDGLCKICNSPETATYKGTPKMLVVDHCHTSGKIRGLLCNNCNRGIGLLKDSTECLQRAITYLRGGS